MTLTYIRSESQTDSVNLIVFIFIFLIKLPSEADIKKVIRVRYIFTVQFGFN